MNRDRAVKLTFVCGILSSFVLRFAVFDFESRDYTDYVKIWYNFYLDEGRWQGLALTEPGASYPVLYLYLLSASTLFPFNPLYAVKMISVCGDYLCAYYMFRVAASLGLTLWQQCCATLSFLFLPTVLMNGSLWAQCDVLYTCCFVASLYYLISDRNRIALACAGVACTLKPQAVFWFPFLLGLFASRVLSWRHLWVLPTVYVLTAIPAILAGKPVLDALWHWRNVDVTEGLQFGVPNWYQWVSDGQSEPLRRFGICATLIFTFALAWWMYLTRVTIERKRWLIQCALASVAFPPFFLPGMHERYFFSADTLSVLAACICPLGVPIAVLLQLASFFSYLPFLFGITPIPIAGLSLLVCVALTCIAKWAHDTFEVE